MENLAYPWGSTEWAVLRRKAQARHLPRSVVSPDGPATHRDSARVSAPGIDRPHEAGITWANGGGE